MKWFFSVFFAFSFVFLTFFATNCIYGYLFPIKFQEEVEIASQNFDVDKAVLYAMINIESRFDKNAISSKGAIGLMQLMPSTAEYVAELLKIEEYDLKEPQDNIDFGTFYLNRLCERFKNLETALVAYNAGPTKLSEWLNNKEYSEDGVTLKKIPFAESERYLQKFKSSFNYYSKKIKD